ICVSHKGATMFGLGPLEIAIIAIVVVLLFGTRRLPELGSGLGKAISNFRKGYREGMTIDVTPDSVTPNSSETNSNAKHGDSQSGDHQ
ncbi:MAG: twin-arginine translocase TatA/TatE family subunit, partial [Bdellovibrionales bacterium]|nr:twin-arginine translocase TatA/TatE family subunit [Bdellovibrionales bacterium]